MSFSNSSYRVISFIILCGLLVNGVSNFVDGQSLSPSSDKAVNDRIQKAVAGQNDVDAELATPDKNRVNPSETLLKAINTMTPADLTESELKQPLQDAVEIMLKGNVKETIAKLDELRGQHPELPPSTLLVGGMFFAGGNSQNGRLYLEQTALQHPEYPSTYTGFARVALVERRTTDALALLEKARRAIDAGSWSDRQQKLFEIEYLDGLIDVAIHHQRLDKAHAHLKELEKLAPESARVALRLAQIEFDLDRLDSSFNYLKRTKELSPNLRMPEVIISDWLLRKQKRQESEKWISQAAADYPNDANVQLDFGRWLLANEKLPQSLDKIRIAEELGADPYTVAFIKGQVFFARRSYDIAAMHFEKLTQTRPGDGDAANMLALSLIESKDAAKRNKAYELATITQRVYPRSPTAMATLGWVNFRLGRNEDAEKAFKQIVGRQGLEPASKYFLAVYLNKLGNRKAAIGLLKEALQGESYFMFRSASKDLLANIEGQEGNSSDPANKDQTPQADKSSGKRSADQAGDGKKDGDVDKSSRF